MKKKKNKKVLAGNSTCLDTGVIYGYGLKLLHKSKVKKNPRKKLKEIKEEGILQKVVAKSDYLFTTILTSYEFVRKMAKSQGVSINQARKIYNQIKEKYNIIEIIPNRKEINISPKLMNDLCRCNLDFVDGLHIYICSLKKLSFITSETKKIENMREFYSEVKSVSEFLKSTN